MAEGFNATQRELEILELRKENTALRAFAKELSNALIKSRPLGGSELFVRRFGDFYADPSYCGQLIEKQQREGIELRLELARMRNASSRLPSDQRGGAA